MPNSEGDDGVCIVPSEALDMDALASALLFAELWQCLAAGRGIEKFRSHPLARLQSRYGGGALSCCLPLAGQYKNELLWRQDIAYLLEFIAKLDQGNPSEHFVTLEGLFGACRLEFATVLSPAVAYVLVDCHVLPRMFWASEGAVADKVIAIWDHRPDTGAFAGVPLVPLRCVQKATSCVALLLELTLELGVFEQLSRACCLFALATLQLDQQQYGGLREEERPLWQSLQFKLGGMLDLGLLEGFCADVLQKRNEPQLGLFEQANADVKFQDFRFGPPDRAIDGVIRVAIGVIAAPFSALQDLCEKGELSAFVADCCIRQQVDFFVLLHRQSKQNPYRGVSLCFTRDWPSGFWSSERVGHFLEGLQEQLPSTVCYSSGAFGKSGQEFAVPELVQLQQCDSSVSRKGFMPILNETFSRLR